MFQGSQFRDYNQRYVKSFLLTTCLMRQNHLCRQSKEPCLLCQITFVASGATKTAIESAADVSDSEESNSDIKNPTFGAERMDSQHFRQVVGIDRPDAMFIRIQNKSANRIFVKYVPWEQRNRTADCLNSGNTFHFDDIFILNYNFWLSLSIPSNSIFR